MEELIEKLKEEIISDVVSRISVQKPVEQRAFNGIEASKYLGIAPQTLCKLVRKGLIEQTTLGGLKTPGYLKEDLDRYLDLSKKGLI